MCLVSIAVEGKSKTAREYTPDARMANTLFCSLEAVTASIAEMQRSLVSLTNAVTSTTSGQLLERNISPAQPRPRHRHESNPMPSPSKNSVAPIQVIRNMNYWITGRRPDGKEQTGHDDAPNMSFEASSETTYLRA